MGAALNSGSNAFSGLGSSGGKSMGGGSPQLGMPGGPQFNPGADDAAGNIFNTMGGMIQNKAAGNQQGVADSLMGGALNFGNYLSGGQFPGGGAQIGLPVERPGQGSGTQPTNPFSQYGNDQDYLSSEYDKFVKQSEASRQQYGGNWKTMDPNAWYESYGKGNLQKKSFDDWYNQNKNQFGGQDFYGNGSDNFENPGYWRHGIDWDTGQATGQGGEIFGRNSQGQTIYKPNGDGSYTDMRTNERVYNAAPPSMIGGTQYDWKTLQPGQSAPKPSFGGKGGDFGPAQPGGPQLGLPVERPGQGQTPQDRYNQYTKNIFGGGDSIYQPNFTPQGQPVGGPAGKPIIGMPGGPQFNPQPQPANRFAPPNAPGVRTQPRVSAVNQANPRNISNRYTRTRAR